MMLKKTNTILKAFFNFPHVIFGKVGVAAPRGAFFSLLTVFYVYVNGNEICAQCSTGCNYTLNSSGGSGSLTLSTGDTLCINATTGNLDVNYTNVNMRPGSGLKMCSDPEDTIKFNANLNFWSGGSGTHCVIYNHGNFEYTPGNLGYNRAHVHNYGYWHVNGDLDQNSTGPPSFTNYAGATVQVDGTMDINNGEFSNAGDFYVDGDLDFNGNDFANTGLVSVGNELTINSSSTVYIEGGEFYADDLTINGGDLSGGTSGCAAFLITNNTTIFSGVTVTDGEIWITDSTDLDSWNTNNCPAPDKDCGGFKFNQTNQCLQPLPVDFLSFSAIKTDDGVLLNWQTITEQNNSHFQIEASDNGTDFYRVGIVQGSGTVFTLSDYGFLDPTPLNGIRYYRLRQVDFDGQFEYSKVVALSGSEEEINVYPVPADQNISISGLEEGKTVLLTIIDVLGREIFHTSVQRNQTIDISDINPGNYTICLNLGYKTKKLRWIKI